MLVFCMGPISYLHVGIVLACVFMLLQFSRLGFFNRNWNNIVPGGVVAACFFLRCMLFIVAWFDFVACFFLCCMLFIVS
jgi:hypothetical protein